MEKLNHQRSSRVQAEADFLLQLERASRISLEKQVVWAVREAIESGRVRPGMRLPSSRRLAAGLRNEIIVVAKEHSKVPLLAREQCSSCSHLKLPSAFRHFFQSTLFFLPHRTSILSLKRSLLSPYIRVSLLLHPPVGHRCCTVEG